MIRLDQRIYVLLQFASCLFAWVLRHFEGEFSKRYS
jgi:hypothetical protein